MEEHPGFLSAAWWRLSSWEPIPTRTPELVEQVLYTGEHTHARHTRYWLDNELLAWSGGQPTAVVHTASTDVVHIHWPSPSDEHEYWTSKTRPVGHPTAVNASAFEEMPTGPCRLPWQRMLAERCELVGLSFSCQFVVRGLAIDPMATQSETLVFDDGRLVIAEDATVREPDVAIEGDYWSLFQWLTGRTLFRDIASSCTVAGDLLLLGSVASVFGLQCGQITDHDLVLAERLWSLVQDHRFLCDQLSTSGLLTPERRSR